MNEQLLEYFQRELEFLAEAGPEFARRHPEIAPFLDAEQMPTADPPMERMVQAFALMNARIHLHMDRDLSELTDALYSVVFPFGQRPIPSCAVVRLSRPAGASLPDTGGATQVPRGAALESDAVDGLACRFRTCYPVSLLPIELAGARLERLATGAAPDFAPRARSVLRLTFHATDGADIAFPETPRLRVFIQAPRQTSFPLYELLVRESVGLAVRGEDGRIRPLPGPGLIQGAGFDPGEALLPWPAGSPPGHRLLLEIFAFPEKFLFVDIDGLSGHAGLGRTADVLIYVGRAPRELEGHVSSDTFLLGCTPVVNLFPLRAEPIAHNHEQTACIVRPDVRFGSGVETYSIDRVTAISPDRSVELPALYEPDRRDRSRTRRAVWTANPRPRRAEDSTTEFRLSVADPLGELLDPDHWTLDVETTCLNGDLPALLPFHGRGPRLHLRGGTHAVVECIVAPTRRRAPIAFREGRRKLVSLLALQSLPLVCENPDRSRLRDVLRLCDPTDSRETQAFVEGVVRAGARQVLEEISVGAARCTCQGVEVVIELDESRFPGGSAYLFAAVLERFLSVSSSINCFSRVVVRSNETKQILYRFPARVAEQALPSVS